MTDDTEWTPCGLGHWRRYRGMRCVVTRTYRNDLSEGFMPEVDATWRDRGLPVLRGTRALSLTSAQSWCERWAEAVEREVTRG